MSSPLPPITYHDEPEKPRRFLLILPITLFLLLCGLAFYGFTSSSEEGLLLDKIKMIPVKQDVFVEEIYGSGNAESSRNTRLINQVMGASTIVDLIPEGQYVKKDEVLLQLDTHLADNNLNMYQKHFFSFEMQVIRAQAKLYSNEISLEKYIEGTFETKLMAIDKNIYTYTENLKRDIDNLGHSEDLLRSGFTTPAQVDVDRVSCRKDQNNLKSYNLRREILLKYTSEKEIVSLLSQIESSRSNVLNYAYIREIYRGLVERYKKQVEFCTLRAPHDGRVAYANQVRRRWRRQSDMIREGGTVYLWQELLLLPDPNYMQVRAKINETSAITVRPGMKVEITFNALPDRVFFGSVTSVSPFPDIGWMTSIKNFITLISIDNPIPEIRTGLTAECIITAGTIKDALIVPRSAIVESGGKYFCLLRKGKKLEPREVRLGPSNEDDVVIRDGLKMNEFIVESAVPCKGHVLFPKMEEPSLYPEENPNDLPMPAVPVCAAVAPQVSANAADDQNSSSSTENNSVSSSPDKVSMNNGIARYDDIKEAIKAERRAFEEKQIAEVKKNYEKTKCLKKYFAFSFMELCDQLDQNGDKLIDRKELEDCAPEFLSFFENWDRNEDGYLSRTDLVLGFYLARTLFEKGLELAEAEILKAGFDAENAIQNNAQQE